MCSARPSARVRSPSSYSGTSTCRRTHYQSALRQSKQQAQQSTSPYGLSTDTGCCLASSRARSTRGISRAARPVLRRQRTAQHWRVCRRPMHPERSLRRVFVLLSASKHRFLSEGARSPRAMVVFAIVSAHLPDPDTFVPFRRNVGYWLFHLCPSFMPPCYATFCLAGDSPLDQDVAIEIRSPGLTPDPNHHCLHRIDAMGVSWRG